MTEKTKLTLTAAQKAALDRVRIQIEKEKPELLAEGRRVAKAAKQTNAKLAAAFELLKAIRNAKGISLTTLSELTGISKPALSRLENDPTANVTINTITRVANALNCEVTINIVTKSRLFPAGSEVAAKWPDKKSRPPTRKKRESQSKAAN